MRSGTSACSKSEPLIPRRRLLMSLRCAGRFPLLCGAVGPQTCPPFLLGCGLGRGRGTDIFRRCWRRSRRYRCACLLRLGVPRNHSAALRKAGMAVITGFVEEFSALISRPLAVSGSAWTTSMRTWAPAGTLRVGLSNTGDQELVIGCAARVRENDEVDVSSGECHAVSGGVDRGADGGLSAESVCFGGRHSGSGSIGKQRPHHLACVAAAAGHVLGQRCAPHPVGGGGASHNPTVTRGASIIDPLVDSPAIIVSVPNRAIMDW